MESQEVFDDWEEEDIAWEREDIAREDSNESQYLKIVISCKPNEQTKKKRRIAAKYSESDFKRALSRRKENVLGILRKIESIAAWSNDPELLCVVQSLLPPQLFHNLTTRSVIQIEDVLELSSWWNEFFRKIPSIELTEEEGRDGSDVEFLVGNVIPNRVASFNQFTQLFYTLLISLNLRIRIVCAIDPLSLSPHDYDDLGDEETVKSKRLRLKPFKLLAQQYFWLELFAFSLHNTWVVIPRHESASTTTTNDDRGESQWIPFDCLHHFTNQPQLVETKIRKNRPVELVIAAEYITDQSILLTNVSKKYQYLQSRFQIQKLQNYQLQFDRWLNSELLQRSNLTAFDTSEVTSDEIIIDLTDDLHPTTPVTETTIISPLSKEYLLQEQLIEQSQLIKQQSLNQKQTLPTTFQGFLNHSTYCLERHLKNDEILHPEKKKVVAMFKGEPVYLTTHREKLKSKLEWRKEMRQIKSNEQPLKTIKRFVRTKSNNSIALDVDIFGNSSSSNDKNETKEKELYAEYQTESLQIPKVVDGILPVNQYGNIEVWNGLAQYVPEGAIYLEGNQYRKVAKTLGIQYAPAVTDFEMKQGKYYPKITGIVILKEHQALLEDGCFEFDAVDQEKQYEEYQKKILQRWKKITRSLLLRERLNQEYGEV